MCGIHLYIHSHPSTSHSTPTSIHSRGPDAHSTHTTEYYTLTHTLLAIQGTIPQKQPILTPTRVFAFNGEEYDHPNEDINDTMIVSRMENPFEMDGPYAMVVIENEIAQVARDTGGRKSMLIHVQYYDERSSNTTRDYMEGKETSKVKAITFTSVAPYDITSTKLDYEEIDTNDRDTNEIYIQYRL